MKRHPFHGWSDGALRGCSKYAERADVRDAAAAELQRRSRHSEPGAVVGFSLGLFVVLALIVLACAVVHT